MKKFIIYFLLIITIIGSFGFVILKSSAMGRTDNYFNKNFRESFSDSIFLRKVLGLNFDGDAKSDYLGKHYSEITIEVDAVTGYSISPSTMGSVAAMIEALTGKKTTFVYSDEHLPYSGSQSLDELEFITSKHRDLSLSDNSALLYVLAIGSDFDEPDFLGSTINENGIVIFEDTLLGFTEINPQLYEMFILSTILHEFGHQLGLGHNMDPKCLMNEEADQRSLVFQNPNEVVVEFCAEEEQELNLIRHKYL